MQIQTMLPTLLMVAAAPLMGQQPKAQLNCDDRGHSGRLERWCEMREQILPAGSALSVDARPNGGISIKGWDRGDVLVRSRVETAAETEADARALGRQVQISNAGGQVRATGPSADEHRHWSVSYEVFVPRQGQVSLVTTNGGIRVADVAGRVEFAAQNGGISLARVSGSVHGHTVNGGLHIELAGDRWNGEGMDVRTTNGGIHLSVPQTYSAHLEAGTTNGGMNLGTPILIQGRMDRMVSTDLGSGGTTIRLNTVNGGISISRN